jgi:ATP-dependent Lon protease
MCIRPGSLLRADGGFLIIEDREIMDEPDAWKGLKRALRTGRVQIMPPEAIMPGWSTSLKPEAIEVNVKVLLLGDPMTYHLLDEHDPDFSQLFKVLVDFDSVIPRNAEGARHYGDVLARIACEEKLLPFDRTAVAALVEHGARIAGMAGKLSARFGRIADVAREAALIAKNRCSRVVEGDDVRRSVYRRKRRADLPSRRFREFVADGTIKIDTRGAVVGQINGLAVLQAGPIVYGFPTRLTATIGPGTAGVINIEREAALSGAIHTKGFYILGGLLRQLLRTEHPLAFDASVAFEQNYGAIDGDSASGAEICCLLSSLTGIPLRQDLAMTGAIDQKGHLLAVGAVDEKVEGFFEACRDLGPLPTQGVIIPKSIAPDLMLRHDVVEACRAGEFHVYAVDTVQEALELLTGIPAGAPDAKGRFPKGTVLGAAVERAREYWRRASASSSRKRASRQRTMG